MPSGQHTAIAVSQPTCRYRIMPRRMRALAAALSSRRRLARCSSFWSCAPCEQLSASDPEGRVG